MLLSEALSTFYVLPLGQSEIVSWTTNNAGLITVTWNLTDEATHTHQEFHDQEIQFGEEAKRSPGTFCVTTNDEVDVAFIALAPVGFTPEAVLINMSGGVIQAVLSERTPLLVGFIDYEEDGASPEEYADIPQDDGTTEEAVAFIRVAEVDPTFVGNALEAIIDRDQL